MTECYNRLLVMLSSGKTKIIKKTGLAFIFIQHFRTTGWCWFVFLIFGGLGHFCAQRLVCRCSSLAYHIFDTLFDAQVFVLPDRVLFARFYCSAYYSSSSTSACLTSFCGLRAPCYCHPKLPNFIVKILSTCVFFIFNLRVIVVLVTVHLILHLPSGCVWR